MIKSKCLIDETFRHTLSLEEASTIRIREYVLSTIKDNENTTHSLDDGVYSGHIARFSQNEDLSHFFIHIKLDDSETVFKGRICSCDTNQQIYELYNYFASNNEIDFAAAIGARVHFAVEQNHIGPYPFCEITELIVEPSSPRTPRVHLDSDFPKQVLCDLNDDD